MNKKMLNLVGVIAAVILSSATTQAKENKGMTEDVMAKVKETGTPGAEHAVLKNFVGKWKVTGHFWLKPNEEPNVSSGTSAIEWALNGGFIKEKFKGNWFGEPVEGLGFVGYDKMKKKYVSIWMDSLSTNIFQAAGQYDAVTKTIHYRGKFNYSVTGELDKPFREEWKIVDNDTHVYSMYLKDPKKKEFKSMALVYKRVK